MPAPSSRRAIGRGRRYAQPRRTRVRTRRPVIAARSQHWWTPALAIVLGLLVTIGLAHFVAAALRWSA